MSPPPPDVRIQFFLSGLWLWHRRLFKAFTLLCRFATLTIKPWAWLFSLYYPTTTGNEGHFIFHFPPLFIFDEGITYIFLKYIHITGKYIRIKYRAWYTFTGMLPALQPPPNQNAMCSTPESLVPPPNHMLPLSDLFCHKYIFLFFNSIKMAQGLFPHSSLYPWDAFTCEAAALVHCCAAFRTYSITIHLPILLTDIGVDPVGAIMIKLPCTCSHDFWWTQTLIYLGEWNLPGVGLLSYWAYVRITLVKYC